jgi:uncharacterized protein GlcG (DUF336 family)
VDAWKLHCESPTKDYLLVHRNRPDSMAIQGDLPILVNGRVFGGTGVSGVTSQQDGIIAAAGVNALQ